MRNEGNHVTPETNFAEAVHYYKMQNDPEYKRDYMFKVNVTDKEPLQDRSLSVILPATRVAGRMFKPNTKNYLERLKGNTVNYSFKNNAEKYGTLNEVINMSSKGSAKGLKALDKSTRYGLTVPPDSIAHK